MFQTKLKPDFLIYQAITTTYKRQYALIKEAAIRSTVIELAAILTKKQKSIKLTIKSNKRINK